MKIKLHYALLLLLFLLAGCGTGQLKTLEVEPNEAIIIAKASIKNGDKIIDKRWNLLWDERLWGDHAVWVEEDGYIFMKIPEGKHFIALLQLDQHMKKIPDNYLTIEVERNKIYYIGDIVFNWKISIEDIASTGVAGTIADINKDAPKIKVDIVDGFEETTEFFNEKFKNSKPIEKRLIHINE